MPSSVVAQNLISDTFVSRVEIGWKRGEGISNVTVVSGFAFLTKVDQLKIDP